MGEMRVRLRLLKEDGLYPREVEDYLIPHASCVTQIVKERDERSVTCRTEDETNKAAHDVIARFHCTKLSVTLEPYADITVDPPVTDQQASNLDAISVAVPSSTHYRRHFVYLRGHDTVNFLYQGLKIEVAFVHTTPQDPSSNSQVAGRAVTDNVDSIRVQVRSSNVEPETDAVNRKDKIESNGDFDDDMDLPASAHYGPVPTSINATPTKSRSAELTIKETPKHANSVTDDEDAFQYSTAPNRPIHHEMADLEGEHDDQSVLEAESPLSKAQATMSHRFEPEERTSQMLTGSNLMHGTNEASSNDDDELTPPRKVTVTYSNRRSRHVTPLKNIESDATLDPNEELPDTATHVPPEGTDAESVVENLEADQYNALTSEMVSPHSLAKEAATRTISNASGKRKLSQHRELVEEESMLANKKHRPDESPTPQSAVDSDEEGDKKQHFDTPEPERERTQSPGPEVRTSKFNPSGRFTQESGEEIVVAVRKTSPQTSVKQQKAPTEIIVKTSRKSETPSSSTHSSTFTGKVPKILLSNDSAARKSSVVKDWLKSRGATIIDRVPSRRTHFVCVIPKEHTLKSAKVLQSLVMNKLVVTEDWLSDSKAIDELQDPADYVHETIHNDNEHDRSSLFSGKYLFFTDSLIKNYKDGWKDIQEVAKAAGARDVDRVPFSRPSFLRDRHNVVFFGSERADNQVTRLMKDHGRTVYSKNFFTDSIISGELELDNDAYKLTSGAAVKNGRRS